MDVHCLCRYATLFTVPEANLVNGMNIILLRYSNFYINYVLMMLGSTFSTAVEHTPHDREVVGMNSDGTWAILSEVCP